MLFGLRHEQSSILNGEQITQLTFTCTAAAGGCGKDFTVIVPSQGLWNYRRGALVQNAFPSLNTVQRESLVTGYCESCQRVIFAEPEDGE
jgi:hypothetical protein